MCIECALSDWWGRLNELQQNGLYALGYLLCWCGGVGCWLQWDTWTKWWQRVLICVACTPAAIAIVAIIGFILYALYGAISCLF